MKLLVMVPAYNEERNIPLLLDQLQPWKEDVLVIDDGSGDRTPDLVSNEGFSMIAHHRNTGLASAYRDARSYALARGYTHLIGLDADGQHEAACIPSFAGALEQYGLVTGNRFHRTDGIADSKLASNLFAILLFSEFLQISLPDAACGFIGIEIPSIPEDPAIDHFEIIYEMKIRHGLSGGKTGSVNIPAIYHPDDSLDTKSQELTGLLNSVIRHHPSQKLMELRNAVQGGIPFGIRLADMDFEALPNDSGAWLFRTDFQAARQYFRSINDTKTGH